MIPSQTESALASQRRLPHSVAARGLEPADAAAPWNAPVTMAAACA